MKAHILLYSATYVKDYRWIYLPQLVSPQDESLLTRIFNDFDLSKARILSNVGSLCPMYCIALSKSYAVFILNRTEKRDHSDRRLFALQGFVFDIHDGPAMSCLLPELISRSAELLDVWSVFSFRQGDQLTRADSSIELSPDKNGNLSEKLAKLDPGHGEAKTSTGPPLELPYSEEGLADLVTWCKSRLNSRSASTFAFGASRSIAFEQKFDAVALYEGGVHQHFDATDDSFVEGKATTAPTFATEDKGQCLIEIEIGLRGQLGFEICFIAKPIPRNSRHEYVAKSSSVMVQGLESVLGETAGVPGLIFESWSKLVEYMVRSGWSVGPPTGAHWWSLLLIKSPNDDETKSMWGNLLNLVNLGRKSGRVQK